VTPRLDADVAVVRCSQQARSRLSPPVTRIGLYSLLYKPGKRNGHFVSVCPSMLPSEHFNSNLTNGLP
jgi:hypothetical protein